MTAEDPAPCFHIYWSNCCRRCWKERKGKKKTSITLKLCYLPHSSKVGILDPERKAVLLLLRSALQSGNHLEKSGKQGGPFLCLSWLKRSFLWWYQQPERSWICGTSNMEVQRGAAKPKYAVGRGKIPWLGISINTSRPISQAMH